MMKLSYKSKIALPESISFDVIWENDAEVDQAGVDSYVDSLKRPKWYTHESSLYKDTRRYMLEKLNIGVAVDVLGHKMLAWTCSQCKKPVFYDGAQLGHKVAWRKELKIAGVRTAAEAKAAYNNLCNLRIECSGCNQSHAWEGGSDSESD